MNYWPRWVRAIRAKTLHLSMAQMGAYDRLLDYYYEEEKALPGNVDACCRICGALTKQDRADVASILGEFFSLTERGYVQQRTEEEIAIARPKIDAARTNGRNGGRPKGSTKKPSGLFKETDEQPTPKAPQPHSSSSPPSVKKNSAAARPDDVPEQVWSDWLALRKAKRAPVTETVVGEARSEAGKAGLPLEGFLRVWCARGSQGLHADWLKPHERMVAGAPPPSKQSALEARNAATVKALSENLEHETE